MKNKNTKQQPRKENTRINTYRIDGKEVKMTRRDYAETKGGEGE